MENQQGYIAIFCWKCKAQNNFARTQVCRVCGCYLRSDSETSLQSHYKANITDLPGFRNWVIAGAVFVTVISGMIYFATRKSTLSASVAAATTKPEDKKPDVELPANSWYNQSWWSYVRKHPSPEQIIKKAIEAGGKSLSPEIAKTLTITGKVAVAQGNCLTQSCGINQVMKKALDRSTFNGGIDYGQRTTIVKPPESGPKPAPKSNEDFKAYDYIETGIIDVAAKMPDKIMRRVTSVTAPGSDSSSLEMREVFNGYSGSKITKYLDRNENLLRASKDTKSFDQMAETRTELELMWRTNFLKDKEFELRGVEKLNDSTVFAIVSKNKAGERDTLYFDSVSGYLSKMDTKGMSVYFDDYRPYEQAIMPYKMYYRKDENDMYVWMRVDIDSWKIGDFVDEAVFEEEKIDPKYFPQSRFN